MSVEFLDNNKVKVSTEKLYVSIDGNTVLVDGRIMVEKLPDKYKVNDTVAPYGKARPSTAPVAAPVVERDPHHYMNGHNGLTVDASVQKAANSVYDSLYHYIKGESRFHRNIEEGIRHLIVNDFGREAAYRIGGGVAKGFRDGTYKGVPASLVFKLIATGEMQAPVEGDNMSLSTKRRSNLTFR